MIGIRATRGNVRILVLLRAAQRAELAPMDIDAFHTFAYFANVLAPVWEMEPLDGKVLKLRGGPFYPELQRELDELVATGLVILTRVGHRRDENGRWRLSGQVSLNDRFASPALGAIDDFDDERNMTEFATELALALSGLPPDVLSRSSSQDATYGDPVAGVGNVIDFGEWQSRNSAESAARFFATLMPDGVTPSREELLHLYLRHLRTRLA